MPASPPEDQNPAPVSPGPVKDPELAGGPPTSGEQLTSPAIGPIGPIHNPQGSPPGPSVYAGSANAGVPAVWGMSMGPDWTPMLQVPGSGTGVYGTSGSGTAVQASSGSGIGVQATSNTGIGLQATSNTQDGIQGVSSAQPHAGVSGTNLGGGFGLWAASDATGGTGIYARGKNYAAVFDGSLSHSNGNVDFNGPVYVNDVLTAKVDIVLGSDCAEDFDIAPDAEIAPGTVMVLNGDGALEPSQCPYDKKVAGVISGAGDYQPGLILGRRDPSGSRVPLALAGKVYCNVDAEYGSVEVGDLLTTSPTLGHAMRADDASKAFGAVIGKALQPLNSGRALVPILIALQ